MSRDGASTGDDAPAEESEADGEDAPSAVDEHEGTEGVRTLFDPDPDRASAFLADAINEGAYVTAFGESEVDYSGRASRTLPAGRRHVTVKPDGTTLVHDADGNDPVNWQPPGGVVEMQRRQDGAVVLAATRENPDEELTVTFTNLLQASAFAVGDVARTETVGTEADLKRLVVDDPALVEAGLQPLATERPTPAGPVDVYAEDRDGRPVVIELKRTRVGPDAVGQLARYVAALDRELHADAAPRGILVAPSVTDRGRQLLAEEGLEYAAVEPPGPD